MAVFGRKMAIPQNTLPVVDAIQRRRFLSSRSLSDENHDEGEVDGGCADEELVSAAVTIIREQRSRTRWSYLRSLRPADGFHPAVSSAIIARLRNCPRMALHFLSWTRNRDLPSLSAAAHVAARSRLRHSALNLLRTAVRIHDAGDDDTSRPSEVLRSLLSSYRTCGSAPFIFDLLIEAYLLGSKLDRAIQIARLLRSRGIHPLRSTSNTLIRSFSLLRGAESGLGIFKEIFRSSPTGPSVQIFNTILLAFHREGSQDRIEEIRRDMEIRGVKPNVFTYSVLMARFCEERKMEEARLLWEEMVAKEIQPDVTAFNTLIDGYCRAGDMAAAEDLHRDMVFRGLDPTCTTLEHLIVGHCKVEDLESAILVYGDLRRRGFSPERHVIDKVLSGLCGKGMAREALSLMRESRIDGAEGFVPGKQTYELLIGGLCDAGNMEEAMKLQAEMAGKGFKPEAGVYRAFIRGYEMRGEGEMARKMKAEMLEKT